MRLLPFLLMTTMLAPIDARGADATAPAGDNAVARVLAQRFAGDRTGACVAAAVIDGGRTTTAFTCADPERARKYDVHTTFEIGSVTKTMTGLLLSDLVERGKLSLDAPFATLLPADAKVPAFDGKPILLSHVVTHTSGLPALPSRAPITRPDNPYASMTPAQLVDSLADVTLTQAPGTAFAYSNYATMLLSYGLTRHEKTGYEAMLRERVFAPLAMDDAYIATPRDAKRVATGHLPSGTATSAWDFDDALAGVGGVRASLDDMIRYVEAQLGTRSSPLDKAIVRAQRDVVAVPGHPKMATNWMIAEIGGKRFAVHEGGTGGFSAWVGFDRDGQRGAVILSDTALHSLGGLEPVGLHLLDAKLPLPPPRKIAKAPADVIDALVGRWSLGPMQMTLTREGDALAIQADGQPKFTLAYDDAGAFFPTAFDALLKPTRRAGGEYAFTWIQGGGAVPATCVASPDGAALMTPPRPAFVVAASALPEYEGVYPLAPGFALTVAVRDGKLTVQGTGQQPLPVDAAARDVFVAEVVGAELRFERDAAGKVIAVALHQSGQILRGEKQ